MSRFFNTIIFFFVAPILIGENISATTMGLSANDSETKTPQPVFIDRMEIGVRGAYKTGEWTSCRVFFKHSLPPDARITLTMLDPDETSTCFYAAFHEISERQAAFSATALIRPGRDNGTIVVRVESDQNSGQTVLAERVFSPRPIDNTSSYTTSGDATNDAAQTSGDFFPPPIPYERPVFLTLTSGDVGLEDAFSVMPFRENDKPVVVRLSSFDELPDNVQAYEMVSTVVLSADPKLYSGITPEHPKFVALRRWLQIGGVVVFNAGKGSEPLLSGEKALFADFLPGKFGRMTQLRLSSPYEIYVSKFQHETVTPMTMTGNDESPFLEAPYFTEPQGIVEAADSDLPLIVRTAKGLGTLVYIGGNLDLAPLKNWRDRPILLAKLLGVAERVTQRERIEGDSLMQRGYNDLSGQLRSALDQFENVKGISFTFVVVLLTVYLVVVGFGDWLLVHKILKRPMLTWLTFPFWVILFCVIVMAILARTRTKDVLVNQTELIDVDTVSGAARGTAWIGIYSPDDRRFDLKFAVDPNASTSETSANAFFSWLGLPGSALGGMSPRTVSAAQWDASYSLVSPPDTIRGLPMQVRSTRMLVANWETANYQNVPGVAKFVEQEGLPCGHLINASPFTWEQCFIVYGRWILSLETIKPGETVEVGTAARRRDLRTAMSGGRNVFEDRHSANQIILGRYNAEATNIPYILRSMMFYRAAGGFDEFGLHNAYQHAVDMSNLLQTKRAVLIAVVSDPKTKSAKSSSNELEKKSNDAANPSPAKQHYGSQIVTTSDGKETPLDVAGRTTCLRLVFAVENNGRGD
ncbi:MAG: hypothetical protein LBT05_08360 [Planctomycetaceae bacterium]|jgi:hypothetical protein|nr:hypothetical protein [Planctomycetaceae bacterium]